MKSLVPLFSLFLAIAFFLCAVDGGRDLKQPQVQTTHVNVTNVTKIARDGKPMHPNELRYEHDDCEEEHHRECEENCYDDEHDHECEDCDEGEHDHECEDCDEGEHDHECDDCDEEGRDHWFRDDKHARKHGMAQHHKLHVKPKDHLHNQVQPKNVP